MGDSLFAETRGYILDRMRRRLAEGSRKMPTEKELAAEVLASYATVRLVMKELEQEGFVRRIRGSGTYLEPQAETLLAEAAWPRLRLFTSPVGGKPTTTTRHGSSRSCGARRAGRTGGWSIRRSGRTTNFSPGSNARPNPATQSSTCRRPRRSRCASSAYSANTTSSRSS